MRVDKCSWNKFKVYGCMMVPMLWFLIFNLYPSLVTVAASVIVQSPTGIRFNLSGWSAFFNQNHRDLWAAVRRTVQYGLIVCCIQNVVALLLALLLNSKLIKGRNFVRGLVFLPYILGAVVCCYTWVLMMGYKGPVLELYFKLGFQERGLLNNRIWAFPSVMFIAVWMDCGYNMVLYIAGLQGIPQELYEAASIDGAGLFARFFRITFPLLWGTISISLLLAIISALGTVQVILYTTAGYHDTQTLAMRIYAGAFGIGKTGGTGGHFNLNASSSQSMVQFFISSFFVFIIRLVSKKFDAME